jgi:hypothetical protein
MWSAHVDVVGTFLRLQSDPAWSGFAVYMLQVGLPVGENECVKHIVEDSDVGNLPKPGCMYDTL